MQLSSDGSIVAVGSSGISSYGRVQIYEYNDGNNSWNQLGSSLDGKANGSSFGKSIGLSSDGLKIVIGASHFSGYVSRGGYVQVFERDSGSANGWTQLGSDFYNGIIANNYTGVDVSISSDGNTIGYGSYNPPNNNGNAIQVPIPALSEERRKDLIKYVHQLIEEGRVAIRNIRRDILHEIKNFGESEHISEDDIHRQETEILRN